MNTTLITNLVGKAVYRQRQDVREYGTIMAVWIKEQHVQNIATSYTETTLMVVIAIRGGGWDRVSLPSDTWNLS